jgi:predicted phosphoribosyltransferase
MGDLNQQAGAIARLCIASTRTTVRQIYEDFDTLQDDVVAFLAANARHKAEAARIVLIGRIVEGMSARQTLD